LSLFSIIQCFLCVSIHDIGGFRRLTFNDVGREGGRGGGRVGSKSAFLAFGRQLCCRPKAKINTGRKDHYNN
jgi:hypothetical protein